MESLGTCCLTLFGSQNQPTVAPASGVEKNSVKSLLNGSWDLVTRVINYGNYTYNYL